MIFLAFDAENLLMRSSLLKIISNRRQLQLLFGCWWFTLSVGTSKMKIILFIFSLNLFCVVDFVLERKT